MRNQAILAILQNLNAARDINASAVVSVDGLSMASAFPMDMDEDRIGAMSAAMVSLAVRVAKEVIQGRLDHAIVNTDNGYMLFFQVNESVLLVTTTPADAKLGLVLYDSQNALQSLAAVL
ncbi:roadblock/LC7 domain-containing protein [Paralysiella testudinis]|uniref:Roadblock/LC7 domain-containing protein n=1 Tax=Paralysiella testudinis TaxID=2809020 RepID=A0A892ZM96_9NEIS|nr:roadblock/LC7 domain-containing protein [Paralysiella testudinis]QRQ82816.1 roadblock/LC7 domain-containing protein [Paralysiella testudinis]